MSLVKKILLSLSIVLGVSVLLSYLSYDGHTIRSFSRWFFLFTVAQIIIHYGITYIIDLFVLRKVRQQEIELAKLSIESVNYLTCPCEKKHVQPVELSFNKDNSYTCEHCSKKVAVNVAVSTALKTEVVSAEQLPELLKKAESTIENK